MSVCPFCKASVGTSSGPCPKCGKRAADHPSIAGSGNRSIGGGFDEELEAPDLVLESGGSVGKTSAAGAGGHASSSYESSGGGMTFDDDDILQDGNAGDLELDMPSPPPSNRSLDEPKGPGTSGQHAAVSVPSSQRNLSGSPPHSSGSLPAAAGPHSSGSLPADGGPPSGQVAAAPPAKVAPPPDTAALVVAKYPPAPSAIWQAPVYACKVLWRQFELRQDLESLRRRRSPDVGLYERALKAHDKKSFALGLALVIAAMTLATFVFFLPVIIRFVRAPD